MVQDADPPDIVAARDWLEKAAAGGNPEAMNNLGVLLDASGARGSGPPRP